MGNLLSFVLFHSSSNDDSHLLGGDARDPRSPRARRTPLVARFTSAAKHRKLYESDVAGASTSSIADPRSPTQGIKRTPLMQSVIDLADPRSPMAGRTPVRRLQFDLLDPREPAANRTPLTKAQPKAPLAASHCVARSLLREMNDNDDDDNASLDDSMLSVASEFDQNFAAKVDDESDAASDEGMLSAADDESFVEVDLDDDAADAAAADDDDAAAEDADASPTDDWAARLAPCKATTRYQLLSPRRSARLSLGGVHAALLAAVASARRAPRAKLDESPPRSPLAALVGSARLASSCPSSPAA